MRPTVLTHIYFFIPLILQKIIWIPTRFVLKFFGHLEIHGLENLKDQKGPFIFACNHTSELDVFFIPASLPFFSRFSPIFYSSREKAFYKGSGWRQKFYGGTFFKFWGAYPVYVGLKNFGRSLIHQIRILHDGGSICFFPEGRTTPDGKIQQAKGGVAYLSYKTHTAIIPVRIDGAFRISARKFFSRNTKMAIKYGKPLHVITEPNTNLAFGDFKMYANYVMKKVSEL